LNLQQRFQQVEDKVERLSRYVEELEHRNRQLEERVEHLESELASRENAVDELQAELNLVKFARTSAQNFNRSAEIGDSPEEVKAYIDNLISEIDNCLALIAD
jgi:methyl-accepting chemotaxis protein